MANEKLPYHAIIRFYFLSLNHKISGYHITQKLCYCHVCIDLYSCFCACTHLCTSSGNESEADVCNRYHLGTWLYGTWLYGTWLYGTWLYGTWLWCMVI